MNVTITQGGTMNRTRMATAAALASIALIAPAHSLGAPTWQQLAGTPAQHQALSRQALVRANHRMHVKLEEQGTMIAGLQAEVTILTRANTVLAQQVQALIVQVGALAQAITTQ